MSNFKNYGQEFHYGDKFLSLVVGNLVSFNNGGFRIFAGWMLDAKGFKFSFSLNLIVNIFLASTLAYIAKY